MSGLKRRVEWFPKVQPPSQSAAGGFVLKSLIGIVAGGLFYVYGARLLGVCVSGLSVLLGVLTYFSEALRIRIATWLDWFGRSLGWAVGSVLLTAVYLIGFPLARAYCWITGADPLRLRAQDEATFWLPTDFDERKTHWIRASFATERLDRRAKASWAAMLVLGGVTLVGAELLLRVLGFGNPILYVPDRLAGYYPAPNQRVRRDGGEIITNQYGMRAPTFPARKPEGTFRILMLGDSTLWGGSYVDQPDIYARLLEYRFSQRYPGRHIEVLNVGVNAWGPFNKLGYIERFGSFDADVAVICLPYLDVYRAFAPLVSTPFPSIYGPPRLALGEVANHLMWRFFAASKGLPTNQRDEQAQDGIATYLRLADTLKAKGCEVLFEVLPSRTAACEPQVPSDEAEVVKTLRNTVSREGYSLGFPAAWAVERVDQKAMYRDACHLDRGGHDWYASYLEQRLADASLKLGKWVGSSNASVFDGGKR